MAANTLLTIDMITLEALAVLENQLTFTSKIRRKYDSYFEKTGAKIGDTLRVRKPARYIGRTGQGYQPEGIGESSVNVSLTTQFGVDMDLSSADLALKVDEFSNRVLKPAIARIANKIDYDGLQLTKLIGNMASSSTTTIAEPTTIATYLAAGVKMDNSAAPNDGERKVIVSPSMQAAVVGGAVTYFNPTSQISSQYKKGMMGQAAGFEFSMDQNYYTHTIGVVASSTPLVNGANQTGATIITDGWNSTATTLNQGDIIQLAGVNMANPQSYATTGKLQDFVVTSTISDTTGAITIPIYPSIITTGANMTVTASPADNAIITIFGVAAANFANISGASSPQGLAFHPDFATLVCADLPLPKGTDMASRKSDDQLGLSIRFIRDYDPVTDQLVNRFDILYGWAVLRPELAARIISA